MVKVAAAATAFTAAAVAVTAGLTHAAPSPLKQGVSPASDSLVDYNADSIQKYTFVPNPPAELSASSLGLTPQQAAINLANRLTSRGIKASADHEFVIRHDSYLDKASGIWHIYVKQQVHGIDVYNGGLHAVVSQSGEVLSYSHSLYNGEMPGRSIGGAKIASCQHAMEKRGNNLSGKLNLAQRRNVASERGRLLSSETALYGFMSAAAYLEDPSMTMSFLESASATHDGALGIKTEPHVITDVPTTKGDVKASLSYVITADSCLALVHRFEVPMANNAYEAYVDAATGDIHAVADWVSSGTGRAPSLARPDFETYSEDQSPFNVDIAEDGEAFLQPQSHDIGSEAKPETHEPTYRVFQWSENDPSEGKRTFEKARRDREASPFGWHSHPASKKPFGKEDEGAELQDNLTHYRDTRGNNVFVSWGGISTDDAWRPSLPRPRGEVINGSRTFDYPYPWRKYDQNHKSLDPKTYALASQVQLFYTINEYHDLLAHLGFDPPAGSFEEYQEDGPGGQAIVAFAQSNAGTNNADMMTPGIGSRPRMRMYRWTSGLTTERDGDFEAGIVIHEATHGLSTRLAGGPADPSCLGWGEAGGAGEGWGDIMATIVRDRNGTTPAFTMGAWASNRTGGIREYPYSRNISINPDTYETVNGKFAVHSIGTIWATIFLDVVEHAKSDLGFHPDLFPPSLDAPASEQAKYFLTEDEIAKLPGKSQRKSKRRIPRHGNTLMMQLLVSGLAVTPCRPTFLDIRSAIVKADEILTGGANECLLWHAFAKRGLGQDATLVGSTPWGGGVRKNGHKTPKYCNGTRFAAEDVEEGSQEQGLTFVQAGQRVFAWMKEVMSLRII